MILYIVEFYTHTSTQLEFSIYLAMVSWDLWSLLLQASLSAALSPHLQGFVSPFFLFMSVHCWSCEAAKLWGLRPGLVDSVENQTLRKNIWVVLVGCQLWHKVGQGHSKGFWRSHHFIVFWQRKQLGWGVGRLNWVGGQGPCLPWWQRLGKFSKSAFCWVCSKSWEIILEPCAFTWARVYSL